MKTLLTLALLALVAAPLHAGRRRAAVAPSESLSIEFVDGGSGDATMTTAGSDAWVDVKSVNATPALRLTRRRFGIRVVREGLITGGTAVITARIDAGDRRATLRIDGRPLTAVPLVVTAHAAVGRVTLHTLEIEIPADAPEGAFATAIAWEVTTEER